MTREELIDALVSESINYIREAMQRGDVGLLADYLSYGFVGYEHMSLEDLQNEYDCNVETQEAA
jgi:hypothetical protein